VYFPESGIISVVTVDAQRRQTEIAIVGREAMTGLPVIHGAERSPFEVYVQVGGEAQWISAQDLRRIMDQSFMLQKCLLRYTHVFGVQVSYTTLAIVEGRLKSGWRVRS
jgi:CRP-like cAMP-binding protein